MNKNIFYWHIGGIIFASLFGSFLHFAYELSGFFKPVALFAAVNESTWEHLKIAFWPVFIFGIIEYLIYGRKINNFFFAKAASLYVIPIIIIVLFYGYTKLIEHNLFLDISIFILSIGFGYLISYKILTSDKNYYKYSRRIIIFIYIIFIAFSLFSYLPPRNFLFLDPVTGQYGIIK